MAEAKLSYPVPKTVKENAKRGLKLRAETGGKGGLTTQQAGKLKIGSGVARANSLIHGNVTYDTIKRMYSFFSRHKIYKEQVITMIERARPISHGYFGAVMLALHGARKSSVNMRGLWLKSQVHS
jgi:hypothetical protein